MQFSMWDTPWGREQDNSIKFLEMVLLNRGTLNGMLFLDVEEAKRWLLEA